MNSLQFLSLTAFPVFPAWARKRCQCCANLGPRSCPIGRIVTRGLARVFSSLPSLLWHRSSLIRLPKLLPNMSIRQARSAVIYSLLSITGLVNWNVVSSMTQIAPPELTGFEVYTTKRLGFYLMKGLCLPDPMENWLNWYLAKPPGIPWHCAD